MDLQFLQIEPTTLCNYTCGFCVGRHMAQKNMTLETFRRAIESVQGLRYVAIQGEGEPLLSPHFFDMVRIAKEIHPKASISFITNGSLFTKDNIMAILSLGISRIMVSIESARPDTFKEIRGGKLDKVINGIYSLLAERNHRKLDEPQIGFAVTILRKTMQCYSELIDLYKQLGMDGGISRQYLQIMENYVSIYDDEMKAQILTATDEENFMKSLFANHLEAETFAERNIALDFYATLLSSDQHGCPWLTNGLYVNVDGIATGCCQIKDARNSGFGQINTMTAAEVFEKKAQMQTELLGGNVPNACKGCFIATRIQNRVLASKQQT